VNSLEPRWVQALAAAGDNRLNLWRMVHAVCQVTSSAMRARRNHLYDPAPLDPLNLC
jgi:hypothetical protein